MTFRHLSWPVALLVSALVLGACLAPVLPVASTMRLPETIRVQSAGAIVTTPLEDYVLGSALAEVSPTGETPAVTRRIFEVQAILARTYAVAHLGRHASEGFDLCDSTHCQLYDPRRIVTSRFAPIARQAVTDTAGVILTFDGRPANALFHSDCGGHTASADDVWPGPPVPYLMGSPDDEPPGTHRTWQRSLPVAELRAALNADPRSEVGRRLDAIVVVSTDESGRAALIDVRGEHTHRLRGDDFRRIVDIAFGDQTIESTRFAITRTAGLYRFDGSGYGHGVGLCQTGAAARARGGESPSAILAAYFPGTALAVAR